jgi:hypothetical protein
VGVLASTNREIAQQVNTMIVWWVRKSEYDRSPNQTKKLDESRCDKETLFKAVATIPK